MGGWFSSITRGLDDDKMSAELKMFNKMKKEAEKLEKSSLSNIPSTSSNGLEDSIDQTGTLRAKFQRLELLGYPL